MKPCRQRLVLAYTHHRAHMAGPQKPLHAILPATQNASIAGGTSTCDTSSEKFFSPICRACHASIAFAGAVVSNPIAKNTTCLSGCAAQSSGNPAANTPPAHRRPAI